MKSNEEWNEQKVQRWNEKVEMKIVYFAKIAMV